MIKNSLNPDSSNEVTAFPDNFVSSGYLEFRAADDRIYGFPTAQLVSYILEANPELGKRQDAPPERLTFSFVSHDVVLTGWRLEKLLMAIKRERLATIRLKDSRYINVERTEPLVNTITVKPGMSPEG